MVCTTRTTTTTVPSTTTSTIYYYYLCTYLEDVPVVHDMPHAPEDVLRSGVFSVVRGLLLGVEHMLTCTKQASKVTCTKEACARYRDLPPVSRTTYLCDSLYAPTCTSLERRARSDLQARAG